MRELFLHADRGLERQDDRKVRDLQDRRDGEKEGHRYGAVENGLAEKVLFVERIQERIGLGFVRNSNFPPAPQIVDRDSAFFGLSTFSVGM